MSASAGTLRLAAAGALDRTITLLARSGARLTLTAQHGNRVAVIALAGPGQGGVDVYAAGTRLGHVSLAATTWHRETILLPVHAFTGSVVVDSVGTAPSLIDAVAVLR